MQLLQFLLSLRSLFNVALAGILIWAMWLVWREYRQKPHRQLLAILYCGITYILERVYLVVAAYLVGAGLFNGDYVIILVALAVINQLFAFDSIRYFILIYSLEE